ncbi:MAG TPA: hypothetical protein VN706_00955 [Gemmatimonadaceae bacterium]|nr:hypothetical protein [Gemmatimonadaceae bacterium]
MHRQVFTALAVTGAALALAACGSDNNAVAPVAPGTILGSTPGWFDGDVVTFDYTAPFQCKNPPSAGSVSGCELGDTAQTEPAANTAIPVLYVMTPMGFKPPDSTLHCPTAGNCVTHPSDVDVSRVFGAGTEKTPLPPHSHIIIDPMNHQPTPWVLEVIGVKDEATWDDIVATQNLGEVRRLQHIDPGNVHITDDIETNIFLFFKVR